MQRIASRSMIERVDEGWRHARNAEAMIERADGRAEVFHALITAPGDFALEARARIGGTIWRVFERVELGAVHHAISLELTPMESQEQRVEGRAADQAIACEWSASFFVPKSDASGGWATDARPHVTLQVGS